MDKDIDREVAEKVMGWRFIRVFSEVTPREYVFQDDKETMINVPIDFHPTTDIAQAWMVEEKIKELDSSYRYGEHLMKIIVNEYTEVISEKYLLAHATPLQRCKAALKAIER